MTHSYLDKLGIYRQLVQKYLRTDWLDRLGVGAYVRSGDSVKWIGAVYALQTQLGMTVHVGGRSALELQGRSHSIPLGAKKKVILISDKSETLPAWFRKQDWEVDLEHRSLSLFDSVPAGSLTDLDCGGFNIRISSPERAIMEDMRLAGANTDIDHIYKLMEGLTTLRPDLIQKLLESCRSIKVKRLFLWSAEEVDHSWFRRLNPSRVDLGKGKRQIYQGGKMNEKYKITIPKLEG